MNTFLISNKFKLCVVITLLISGCSNAQLPEKQSQDIFSDVFVSSPQTSSWYKPEKTKKTKAGFIRSFTTQEGKLSVTCEPYLQNSLLVTARFTSKNDLDSVSLGMRFFSLDTAEIKQIYCLPHSLPFLRKESRNKIPAGYITNGQTFNNTFSLITEKASFSVSVVPPSFRLDHRLDEAAAREYAVGFFPAEQVVAGFPEPISGSITLVCNHNQKVAKGEVVVREFLVSRDENTPGRYATGLHIGEYMNFVKYSRKDNLYDVYRKSMDFLLNNPHCFISHPDFGANYYGAIYSKTGDGYGNGKAFYAMYGNSFSVAALNQYKKIQNEPAANLSVRLDGIDRFLQSDVLTKEGAYWSMLDLLDGKGYVDQAYRKWVETHATGWITYYLLNAYQTSGNDRYKELFLKTLKWLSENQLPDGSYPKYFEEGKASEAKLGDVAWVALALLKAAELNIQPEGTDLKRQGISAAEWMIGNVVAKKEYFGSFEDVGGVNDSYCPSISARALTEAYKATKDKKFLIAAEEALSVSLSWITCDYVRGRENGPWGKPIQPAYAQIESVSCYYPCSYTLPAMCLAAAELALCTDNPEKKNYWTQISRQFSHVSDYIQDTPETQAKYGMEWLLAPYLVFSEWGNSQVCWSILETFRTRIHQAIPEFQLDHLLHGNFKGSDYSAFIPEYEGNEQLISFNRETDPMFFKDNQGNIGLLLLSEGQSVKEKLSCKSLLRFMEAGTYELRNVLTNKVVGTYTTDKLAEGIDLAYNDFLFLKFTRK
jgi:hypothetical protein